MCSLKPKHNHPVTSRVKAWGTSFRGIKEKKEAILQECMKEFPEFFVNTEKKRNGQLRNEYLDMGDAITQAKILPVTI